MFNLFRKKVVTRIAPSPTGVLHIGTARSALFNYLFAKKHGGKFILRIEDTDKERSTKEFEKNILDNMEWLGLNYDAMYRQSDRTEIYKKYTQEMIDAGTAYISKETEGDRAEVIRFKNPNKKVVFTDLLRGEISFDTTELGDFVIAKSLEEPLYHLAVVIDDFEMEITHIIRGEDGISNTPRQILIQEAIGAKTPIYAHVPFVLGKDRSKLSKRHGAKSLSEYAEAGYLKEAIINYLAFLGWNPGDDREVFNLDELIKEFSIEKLNKAGAVFDEEKLNWYNREYLKKMSDDVFLEKSRKYFDKYNTNDQMILDLKNIIIERINTLSEIQKMVEENELDYFFTEPTIPDISKIIWKDSNPEQTIEHLNKAKELLPNAKDKNDPESIKETIWDYASEKGRGQVLWPLRYSLSGKDKSPDPFTLISILGLEETTKRIDNSIKLLQNEKGN